MDCKDHKEQADKPTKEDILAYNRWLYGLQSWQNDHRSTMDYLADVTYEFIAHAVANQVTKRTIKDVLNPVESATSIAALALVLGYYLGKEGTSSSPPAVSNEVAESVLADITLSCHCDKCQADLDLLSSIGYPIDTSKMSRKAAIAMMEAANKNPEEG